MIGALTFISPGDIRHVVALKNFLNGWMRGVAVLVLALGGNVNWKYAAPMAIGGLVGGYIGGIVSHRANRTVVRSIVIGLGLCRISALFLEVVRPEADTRRRRVGRAFKNQRENFHSLPLIPKFSKRWEPPPRAKSKPVFVGKGLIAYEKANNNYGGIHSIVWDCCVSRSERGSNFSCDRSSRPNAAGRESFDRTWLGWNREGALVGQRHGAELRRHRRAASVGARLGKNCAR